MITRAQQSAQIFNLISKAAVDDAVDTSNYDHALNSCGPSTFRIALLLAPLQVGTPISYPMKYVFPIAVTILAFAHLALAEVANEAIEPTVAGPGVVDLLEDGTLNAWKVPSEHWYLEENVIVGDTGTEKLNLPEWLYTTQRFADFEFTCELRLTGDNRRNTGIYYRVNTFLYEGKKSYEAPSGYEFDAAFHNPGKRNFRGSLGDWYARPSLRVFPDQNLINQAYKVDEWNRMTIRARGNRLEYWINGFKVMDYVDRDPNGSREGVIGFQIHDGAVMKVEYRNVRVLPLGNSE